MKYLLILLAFVFNQYKSEATCIILYTVHDTIYVAADSRVIYLTQNPDSKQGKFGSNDKCKIITEDKINYAIEGVLPEFSEAFIHDYLKNKSNINHINSDFPKILSNDFRELLSAASDSAYASFEEHVKSGRNVLNILFFDVRNGKPNTTRITIKFTMLPDKYFQVDYESESGLIIATFGLGEEIAKLGKDGIKKAVATMGIVNALNYLVGLEIKKHPNEVGAPIDILKVDKFGRKWIAKKSNCKQ